MILTTHALVGAVIGKNISNPYAIVALAIAAHFIMDTFRHGEYVEIFKSKDAMKKNWWKIALDIATGFSILLFIVIYKFYGPGHYLKVKNIFLGTAASTLPDLVTFLYWKYHFPFLKKYYDFHCWIHRYDTLAEQRVWNMQNATNDMLISVLALFFLLF